MKKIRSLLLLLIFLLGAATVAAQSQTTVSATVTDASGIPYAGGTVKAQISPPGVSSPCVTNSAGDCVPIQGTVGPASLDSAGKFTLDLYPNASITPAATQWTFTVCIAPGVAPPAGTGPQCFSAAATIAGVSQDLSSALSAAAPLLARGAVFSSQSPNTIFAGPVSGGQAIPAFRLAVSADLPTTIASNTTGNSATATALAATPTNCGTGVAATGIAANGNATGCFTPASATILESTADQTVTGTTFTNVTGFSFSVAANTDYRIKCSLFAQVVTGGNGQFQWTGPASPGNVVSALTSGGTAANGFNLVFGISSTSVTFYPMTMDVQNASNSGTVQLQMNNNTAGDGVTLKRGSFCIVQ